jgi:hypothetical protein
MECTNKSGTYEEVQRYCPYFWERYLLPYSTVLRYWYRQTNTFGHFQTLPEKCVELHLALFVVRKGNRKEGFEQYSTVQ